MHTEAALRFAVARHALDAPAAPACVLFFDIEKSLGLDYSFFADGRQMIKGLTRRCFPRE